MSSRRDEPVSTRRATRSFFVSARVSMPWMPGDAVFFSSRYSAREKSARQFAEPPVKATADDEARGVRPPGFDVPGYLDAVVADESGRSS